jgi:hypothetical protein
VAIPVNPPAYEAERGPMLMSRAYGARKHTCNRTALSGRQPICSGPTTSNGSVLHAALKNHDHSDRT